jgi:hypothetical protein
MMCRQNDAMHHTNKATVLRLLLRIVEPNVGIVQRSDLDRRSLPTTSWSDGCPVNWTETKWQREQKVRGKKWES